MRPRISAKAIIIENGRLLAIHIREGNASWYILPGGGQKHGESLMEALRRECREELGAEIEPGRVRFIRDYIGRHHEFAATDGEKHQVEIMFECRLATPLAPEAATHPDGGQLGTEWVPLKELEARGFYPKVLARLLRKRDLAATPVYLGDVN